MTRLSHKLSAGSICLTLLLAAACDPVNTKPDNGGATPTPVPTSPFTCQTYAAALRAASVKLRAKLPDYETETKLILEPPAGTTCESQYNALIDKYLGGPAGSTFDPTLNPDFLPQMREFYRSTFLMGGVLTNGGAPVTDPAQFYARTNVNYDLAPNLAAHLVGFDKPVTELLTADYCVGGTDNGFQMLNATQSDDACFTTTTAGTPTDPLTRAGMISYRSFLRKFGQADTVNMRRVSVVHQLFACGIYPDTEDEMKLVRSNDNTVQSDTTDLTQVSVNGACVGPPSDPNDPDSTPTCPDNSGVVGQQGGCTGPLNWPCNNHDTKENFADDFADPSLGKASFDPADPPRLHKKYQSKLAGASGAECHQCHGHLNMRRPVFTPYDLAGVFDPTRTIGNKQWGDPTAAGTADNSVESPEVNGQQDYCGAFGDTDDAGTNPDDEDMDANGSDCADDVKAYYFGREIRTLRDFGNAILDHDLTGGRFYTCMTNRHYNFVLGKSQGELSMQAAGGSGPTGMDPAIMAKYYTVYESSGWKTRELLRAVLKGPEFLAAQQ